MVPNPCSPTGSLITTASPLAKTWTCPPKTSATSKGTLWKDKGGKDRMIQHVPSTQAFSCWYDSFGILESISRKAQAKQVKSSESTAFCHWCQGSGPMRLPMKICVHYIKWCECRRIRFKYIRYTYMHLIAYADNFEVLDYTCDCWLVTVTFLFV